MPQWSDQPPLQDVRLSYRILRTPASQTLSAIITSDNLTGTATHYVSNRTVPCERPDECPFCEDGHSNRWHAYVGAILASSLEHFIFECTAKACQPFVQHFKIEGSLRGCGFHAHRPSKRTNGRVVIATKVIDQAKWRLPPGPDITAVLSHIWNVRNTAVRRLKPLSRAINEIGATPADDDGRYRPPKPPGNGAK